MSLSQDLRAAARRGLGLDTRSRPPPLPRLRLRVPALARGSADARRTGPPRHDIGPCNTFALLGVKAQAGRTLTDDDCEPTAPPVTVISDALWRRKLGADPSIVEKTLTFAGQPLTVVGVLPPVLLPAELIGEGRDTHTGHTPRAEALKGELLGSARQALGAPSC